MQTGSTVNSGSSFLRRRDVRISFQNEDLTVVKYWTFFPHPGWLKRRLSSMRSERDWLKCRNKGSGLESQPFSLALANRSACLQKAKFYRKAVEDIWQVREIDAKCTSQLLAPAKSVEEIFQSFLQARKCGYPKDKMAKLNQREAACLAELAAMAAKEEDGEALLAAGRAALGDVHSGPAWKRLGEVQNGDKGELGGKERGFFQKGLFFD